MGGRISSNWFIFLNIFFNLFYIVDIFLDQKSISNDYIAVLNGWRVYMYRWTIRVPHRRWTQSFCRLAINDHRSRHFPYRDFVANRFSKGSLYSSTRSSEQIPSPEWEERSGKEDYSPTCDDFLPTLSRSRNCQTSRFRHFAEEI